MGLDPVLIQEWLMKPNKLSGDKITFRSPFFPEIYFHYIFHNVAPEAFHHCFPIPATHQMDFPAQHTSPRPLFLDLPIYFSS